MEEKKIYDLGEEDDLSNVKLFIFEPNNDEMGLIDGNIVFNEYKTIIEPNIDLIKRNKGLVLRSDIPLDIEEPVYISSKTWKNNKNNNGSTYNSYSRRLRRGIKYNEEIFICTLKERPSFGNKFLYDIIFNITQQNIRPLDFYDLAEIYYAYNGTDPNDPAINLGEDVKLKLRYKDSTLYFKVKFLNRAIAHKIFFSDAYFTF